MKRYVYYLIIVNMLGYSISEGHKILLNLKEQGSLLAMVLSVFLGFIILFGFIRFFQTVPGKDLPDLLLAYFPKWLSFIVLGIISVVWFIAGLVSLISFVFILKRFLTPEIPTVFMIIIFLTFITFGILLRTKSILYTLEIVLLITFPFLILLLLKAITSNEFELDYVKEAVMHINHFPSFSAIANSLYVYLGITNLIIFNNQFQQHDFTFTWKDYLIALLLCLGTLLVSFFIPIGLLGYENIDTIPHPMMIATDTLIMPLGIIERVLYVMLTVSIFTTFLSILVHWHVVVQITKKLISTKKITSKQKNWIIVLIIGAFWVISIYLINVFNEYWLLAVSRFFNNLLPFFFFPMILLFQYLKRRAR
ncbi:hypothetical protein CQJ30_09720 [Caldibacillus thermoamylovorans]|uniref:GerAB/ArcD/ProY family transporter n=1 Tax=Caldibacillus thermoamylovorans TaxID=35841 RepID=UPI000D561705|nr:GerAB/ArcD/ProY family transporter [Caldibacillus thermoamylovorans]AWI12410.1 hypothetical protein CQJ30_09720 [Caldibacillus thermoamylovorans]